MAHATRIFFLSVAFSLAAYGGKTVEAPSSEDDEGRPPFTSSDGRTSDDREGATTPSPPSSARKDAEGSSTTGCRVPESYILCRCASGAYGTQKCNEDRSLEPCTPCR